MQARTRELEQSYSQLRSLTTRLDIARKDERARLAREVHDELGGSLTGLKMDLRRLRRVAAERNVDLSEKLDDLARSIDSLVETVRRIATELRPAILDDLGLGAALEWYLGDFRARSGIECRLVNQVEEIKLDRDRVTAVFRVFQEALTNVARHAQATQVEVLLDKDNGHLLLEVRDNGRGITPAEIAQSHSLGLAGMRDRVAGVSGQLIIQGLPDQGTCVSVKIPLQ